MENYTLYSHSAELEGVLLKVQQAFPKAVVEVTKEEEITTITVMVKGGLFSKKQTLTLKYRQRLFPSYHLKDVHCAVSNQFLGMYHYVAALPARDEELRVALLKKIETLNSEIAVSADPVLSPTFQQFLLELAGGLQAILFVGPGLTLSKSTVQHFLDSQFYLLMDTEGHTGTGNVDLVISSRYFDDPMPANETQLARKNRTEALLERRKIRVNHHLPVVPDVAAITLRSEEEILERIYCLTVLAAKGEGVRQEVLDDKIEELNITGFTPIEAALLDKETLTEQEQANTTWRYECVYVLLWALGLEEELGYPDTICDVPHMVEMVINQSRVILESKAQLRDAEEILEQLDQIYRMHWACVEAHLHHQQPEGGMEAGVVYERHYALNWLTGYEEQEWDEVQTDT
ncbi:hypothetical protein HNQ91_000412 [Filimonas zeae]|uniref:DUF4272 domain-containing protein n=1 Tax=Filimonas zeae TaxID=1737353 RepID=A0A917MSP0_9BACT|nr:DUF4272 domain-containing protein [Filimonas zeae]MDR6337390.1 hypothetical protein [Filimonas zeae]GGH58380.1 hypothetical protein GCM10011379_04050 [Filimonas zeae]